MENDTVIDNQTIGNVTFENNNVQQAKRYALNRVGRSWTILEDTDLRDDNNNVRTIKEILNEHKRSYGAIQSRLVKMGLISQKNV